MNYQKSVVHETLEWPYAVDYSATNRINTDVLVIGGSFAGCYASLAVARRGATVALVDKAPIKRSGGGGAGIDHWTSVYENPNSPMKPEEIIEKTMEKVQSLGHRDYIAMKGTWDALLELEKMGLPIRDSDRDFEGTRTYDNDTGLLKAYNYQNLVTVKLRAGHFVKPVIAETVRKNPNISVYERVMVTMLLTENGVQGGRVIGAVGFSLETGEFYVFSAKSVILSTGYMSGNWIFSTEIAGNGHMCDPNDTGDGFAMAWKAGAEAYNLSDAGVPGGWGPYGYPNFGLGNCTNTWFPCNVVDNDGREVPWQDVNGTIITDYEKRNLPAEGQPYMNVSASDKLKGIDTPELIKDLGKRIKNQEFSLPMWADLTSMPDDEQRSIWGMMVGNEGKSRFPVYDYYTRWGFNPETDMLMGALISPADRARGHGWFSGEPGEADSVSMWRNEGRHYANVASDWNLMTSLPGLFCAGAVSGLEGCSFACSSGDYAGNRAFEFARDTILVEPSEEQIREERKRIYAPVQRAGNDDNYVSWKELWAGTARVMQCCCGEYKTLSVLKTGLKWLDSIREYEACLTYARNPHELARVLECETRLTCSKAYICGCISKLESERLGVDGDTYIFNSLDGDRVITEYRGKEYWLKPPYASSYLENYQRCRAKERGDDNER